MAKTRLPLTPVTIEVDNPTSSTAGDVCIEEMSQAGYICDVGGKVNLNDECELMANPSGFPGSESGIIVGNTTNLSLAPLDVLRLYGVGIPNTKVNINGQIATWELNFADQTGVGAEAPSSGTGKNLFVAGAWFTTVAGMEPCSMPYVVKSVLWDAQIKNSFVRGSGLDSNPCGCSGRSVAAASHPLDTYPVDIQDEWFRYTLFQPNGLRGNRLMMPGTRSVPTAFPEKINFDLTIDTQQVLRVGLDPHGHKEPIPLRAREIVVAATNVQWRPDSRRPILIQQPQGIPDHGQTDLGTPVMFPGLPKYSSVIYQFPDKTAAVLTSQCRGNPQSIHLLAGLDVLFQTNTGVGSLDEKQGVIDIWVKVVVSV